MKQATLAKKLGVRLMCISSRASGLRVPRSDMLDRWENTVGVQVFLAVERV